MVRKRDMLREKNNIIKLVIIILYIIFTVVSFVLTFQKSDVAQTSESLNMESEWLTEVPFHQAFQAYNFTGARVWVTNESGIDIGNVVVTIGDEETGQALFEERIPCYNVSTLALTDYIEVKPDADLFEGDKISYLELSVEGIDGRNIRTYTSETNGYPVSRMGDEKSYEGRGLYFSKIQKTLPSVFVIWIMVTGMLIGAVVIYSEVATKHMTSKYLGVRFSRIGDRPLLVNIIPAVILIVAVVIGLFGKSFSTPHYKKVDLKDSALTEGYTLKEHSSYHQTFKVESDGLKEIDIHFSGYFINNALFVVSIQRGTEDVFFTTQSNDLTVSGETAKSYYILDLTDASLNVGEEYDLYIYTGFIEENEQEPTITQIEYVYD